MILLFTIRVKELCHIYPKVEGINLEQVGQRT